MIVIIGAGAIGIEFAYFYSTFGSKVTIIEAQNHILPNEDEDISMELEKIFKSKKIECDFGNWKAKYKENFEEKFGVKLGFMGMFLKASSIALQEMPIVNASIDGTDIVYHGYQDIGVAVSTERGLVVPILRGAENLSIAEMEMGIANLALKARDSKLSIEEMSGGTFTITNGGIYGSLLSTPILNPPQSAILGMHAIQKRPIVIDGEVSVRPMMNLALSYDHRLIDGKDAVQFLVCIKQLIENPSKILLEI